MKLAQVAAIHQSLTILSQERLAAAYEIAKNIRTCESILNEVQELMRVLFTTYVDRDLDGKIKEYEEEDGKKVNKISDLQQLALYREELAKIDAEERDVKLVPIPAEKISGKELSAAVLMPLLGTVILD